MCTLSILVAPVSFLILYQISQLAHASPNTFLLIERYAKLSLVDLSMHELTYRPLILMSYQTQHNV